jgi:hypothetical protein
VEFQELSSVVQRPIKEGVGLPPSSFGRLYLRCFLILAVVSLVGAFLVVVERPQLVWVAALNYVGALLGIAAVFAPAMAIVLVAVRAVWRRI